MDGVPTATDPLSELSAAKVAPHVLKFGCELLMDGRTLRRPVNYALVRITPPDGADIDQSKRPFVIVDPRAGHGSVSSSSGEKSV